jgi:hypothetical protein
MAQLQKQNRQKCAMFPQKQKHIKFHIPEQLLVPFTEVLHFPSHSIVKTNHAMQFFLLCTLALSFV